MGLRVLPLRWLRALTPVAVLLSVAALGHEQESGVHPIDSSEFQINLHTPLSQYEPEVGTDADGRFFAAWSGQSSAGNDASGESVHFRRIEPGSNPGPLELQANTLTASD